MEIKLKKITLLNFKGIRQQVINFNPEITNISGDNGVGKSTIMDAFLWLLFGKNSDDAKDFNVKTLDKNNIVIPKLDHEVEAVLIVNEREITLKRCLKEKWTKKRGAEIAEFTGNETLFFYNDVPLQSKEYADKIDSIVREGMFKLLTNNNYFNSLHWEKRRAALMQIVGEIDDMEIVGKNKDFLDLLSRIESQKITLEQLKISLSAKKKKLKEELEQIQTRIEEVNRGNPAEPDYLAVNAKISVLQSEINEIDTNIQDVSKQNENALKLKQAKQNEIFELKSKLQKIEFAEKTKIQTQKNEIEQKENKIKNEIEQKQSDLKNIEIRLKNNELKQVEIDKKIVALREKFATENAKEIVFDESKFICPACQRAFESENIEATKKEMIANFNNNKINIIDEINRDGKAYKVQLEEIEQDIKLDKEKINALKSIINELSELQKTENKNPFDTVKSIEEILKDNFDYENLKQTIALHEEQLQSEINLPDTSEMQKKKRELTILIDDEKQKLALKSVIESNKKRIVELGERERFLAQEISNFEKQEFCIANFIKAKSDIITERVNKMFSFVKFKLFNILINGSDEPTCETLIDGVPFADANYGSKICAGLEIIKVFSKSYDILCPVFVDNKESVSVIPTMENQTILLTKIEGLKQLTIQ